MRENRADKILEKIIERKSKVSDLIANQYKATVPFASQKLSTDEQVWAFENLGYLDREELRQQYGDDAMNELQLRINQLQRR